MAAARIQLRGLLEDPDEWRVASPAEWVDTCEACGVQLTLTQHDDWSWREQATGRSHSGFSNIEEAAYHAIDTLCLMN